MSVYILCQLRDESQSDYAPSTHGICMQSIFFGIYESDDGLRKC